MIDVNKVIEEVPKYKEFLNVDELNQSGDELAKDYPNIVKKFAIGKGRNGESIQALKIGNGKYRAILWGFPHPNEPVGSMTLEFFSTLLAENENLRKQLNYTWYIIKCADPYSARLNEGWFKGQFDVKKQTLNFYRSPSSKQIEWTFPIRYKTLKWNKTSQETKVLIKLMNQVKPNFIYPLHDSSFGGVYFYISKHCPKVYPKLHALVNSQGLPLKLGEAEVPYCKKLADAIFKFPSIKDKYEFYKKHSGKDPVTFLRHGASSADYAEEKYGSFCLVCEVPYLEDKNAADTTITDIKRKESKLGEIEIGEKQYGFVDSIFKKYKLLFDKKSPFYKVLVEYLKTIKPMLESEKRWILTDSSLKGFATRAEVFDSSVAARFYGLRRYGMLIRLVKDSLKKKSNSKLVGCIEELKRKLDDEYKEFERQSKYKVIPIQKLVRIQLGTGLYIADYVKR